MSTHTFTQEQLDQMAKNRAKMLAIQDHWRSELCGKREEVSTKIPSK